MDHATQTQDDTPQALPVALAPAPEICGTCKHWQPLRNDNAFGHCGLSGKAAHAPIITTDRQSCSRWLEFVVS